MRRLALIVLVAAIVCVGCAMAQSCSNVPSTFRFKQAGRPGVPSYIVAPNTTVNVLTDATMPPIIISLLYLDTDTNQDVPDFSLDGTTVDVEITPQLRMSGNSVEINQGEALFTSLVIQEQPLAATDYRLTFRVNDPSVNMALQTGVLNFVNPSAQFRLNSVRFGNYGFLFRQQQVRIIPVNQPMPMFFLEGLDVLGRPVTQSITVTVTTSDGTVSPTSVSGNGRVQFTNFIYTPSATGTDAVVFTFTASDGGTPVSVSTQPLTPQVLPARNQFMLFDSATSFFAYDNVGDTAVRDLPMPIITIQLYTSTMQPDRSNTGLVITAHSEQGTLQGGEALVVRGVARFRNLMFVNTAPRSAVITFKAGPQGNLPVQSQEIYSGAVQVAETSIKAKHLAFASSSFIQANQDRKVEKTANGEFTIPSIVVQVKDSAYQIDSTANGIELQLLADPPTVRVSGTPLTTVINGIAAMSNVRFTGADNVPSVRLKIVDSASIRQPLDSGTISLGAAGSPDAMLAACLTSTVNCPLRIRFADSSRSYVYEEEQELFTTVGGKIPDIRVELVDEFDRIASSLTNPPRLVAFTSDSPLTDTLLMRNDGANEGLWRLGVYVFGCLIFRERPNGLVRLSFRLVDADGRRYVGINDLRTGFVTTTRNPTPNFGLRFAQEGSLFTYPGQPSSAVVNIALPTIVIEMVDSLHQFDNSNSDVVIVASASSGELDPDGSREVMSKGRASFSTLKFTSVGDEPTITFRALDSTTQPVAGKAVTTGTLTVTTLPIRSFEIVFSPVVGPNNNVSYPFQSFDIAISTPIMASIAIRDSAHQFEPVATETVIIEVIPDGAQLDSSNLLSIAPPGPANVNFTNRIRDARASEIFLTYRVTGGSNPLLTGKSLTIGPIRIIGQSALTCSNQLDSPTAVAEFKIAIDEFRAQESDVRLRIAYMMGVEPSRVLLSDIRLASGVEHDTLRRWTGTKVDVTFDKVQPGSTNRKTSAQLYAEFIALRPTCEQGGLCLAAVYSKEIDKGCDINNFYQLQNASEACTRTLSECECYADQMFKFNDGQVCKDEPSLESAYYEICRKLSVCRTASIQSVCDDILKAKSVNLIWLWATIGSVGGVVLILFLLKQRGFIKSQGKASLHNTIDTQY